MIGSDYGEEGHGNINMMMVIIMMKRLMVMGNG